MNYIPKFFKQSSYYFISNSLVVFAGFISFPVLTRILSLEEYGMFSLITITIAFGISFSKFGLQHAALRFHTEFKEKVINLEMSYYYTTLFISSFVLSGGVLVLVLFLTNILFKNSIDKSLLEILPLVGFLIILGSVSSILTIFLRADNRGGLYSIFTTLRKYGQFIIALVVFFVFIDDIYGIFLGYAIADLIILILLISFFLKKLKLKHISLPFLKDAISYGFPLIWMEVANMILSLGDRYMIKYFLGSEPVGVYSAGYNICNLSQSFLQFPLRLAVIPIYLEIWNRDGENETKTFLKSTLNYYFMLAIPMVIGLSWFGKEIITLIATSKFEDAAAIIPFIIAPLVLHGAFVVYGAGLFIQKKTKTLMTLTAIAAIINLSLNYYLIPHFGISGAAYATLISYVVLVVLIIKKSFKYLRVNIQINGIMKFIFLSILTVFLVSQITTDTIVGMLFKSLFGVILYLLGIFCLEKDIREKVVATLDKY